MISSSELSALTASFLQSGGQIEKHDIIIRDYAAPKGGFMMTSANDAPKNNLKARKKRSHSYAQRNKAIEVMRENKNLSTDEIAELAGVSQTTAREAIKYIKYKVRRLSSARPPATRELILQHAGEDKTASELADELGTTASYVFRTCMLNGIKLKRAADEPTELESRILAIKTLAYTAKEIAEQVGCTQPHVRVVCKKYNRKLKSGVKNYVKRSSGNDSTKSDNA